jgi:hypothetical protein
MGTKEQVAKWRQWIIDKFGDSSYELGVLGEDENDN